MKKKKKKKEEEEEEEEEEAEEEKEDKYSKKRSLTHILIKKDIFKRWRKAAMSAFSRTKDTKSLPLLDIETKRARKEKDHSFLFCGRNGGPLKRDQEGSFINPNQHPAVSPRS